MTILQLYILVTLLIGIGFGAECNSDFKKDTGVNLDLIFKILIVILAPIYIPIILGTVLADKLLKTL